MPGAVFAGKAKDIDDFNSKVKEHNAKVYYGGALLCWLWVMMKRAADDRGSDVLIS